MPEEFIEAANERLAAINAAYDAICRQRGIS
jgi:DnaJ-domain-containing protein 1